MMSTYLFTTNANARSTDSRDVCLFGLQKEKVQPSNILQTQCSDGSYIIVPSSTTLSSIFSSLPTSGPIKLDINGTLTIDMNWTLPSGSNIIFDDLSGMVVQTGKQLYATGTTFRGCDFLWNSINIKNGAYGTFYQCKFSDALHALDYENQSYLGIANCNFNNNFVGVRLNNTTGGTGVVYWATDQFTFINNKFQGGPLLTYTGSFSDWHLGQGKTYAGLELNFIQQFQLSYVTAGGITYQYNNEFKNAIFGILSNESSIIVEKTSFGRNIVGIQEIANTPGQFVRVLGGVSNLVDFRTHTYAAINVSGFNKTIDPFDASTSLDVPKMGSDITVTNATFASSLTWTQHAILSQGLTQKRVYIYKNNFDYCYNGIIFAYNPVLNYIQVENNTYTYLVPFTSFLARRFLYTGLSTTGASAGKLICKNNIITSVGSFIGIASNSLNNQEIINNTITNSSTDIDDQFIGIQTEGNSSNYLFTNNTVNGPGKTHEGSWAIQTGSSTGTSFCNYTNDTRIGLFILGDCNPSSIYSNHMHDHHYGLEMDSYSAIGLQDNHQNEWHNNPYNGDGAFYGPFNLPGTEIISQFWIASSIPVQTNTLWPNTVSKFTPHLNNAIGTWFRPQGNQKQSCTSPGGEFQEPNPVFTELNDQDFKIASGDYENESEGMRFTLNWGLFEKLKRTPALIAANAVYNTFYQHTEASNIGRIYEVYDKFQELSIESGMQGYRNYNDDLVNQKDLISNSIIEYLGAVGNQAKTEKWQEVQTELSSLENLETDAPNKAADRLNSLNAAQATMQSSIGAMSNTNVIEDNFSIIYGIIINHLDVLPFNFSENEINSITAVAIQCPVFGGRAVTEARNLLALSGIQNDYNDEDCLLEQRTNDSNDTANNNKLFEFTYQNPASKFLSYSIRGFKDANSSLRIINIAGNIVANENNVKTRGQIDVSALVPGLYFIECQNGEDRIINKLIIQ